MIPTSNVARLANIKMALVAVAALLAVTACGKKDSGASSADQNPPPIVDLAGSYNGQNLNPRQALDDKMGRWEQVDGDWYFVPDLTLVDDSQDWEPYQHGYWTWDEAADRGWTWVSHEPWGWMTEHYGVWRHHRRLGWIWIPSDNMEYQPHGVTWFDDGDYVGWYPYNRRYAGRYRQSRDFNDGFWDVDSAAVSFRTGNSNFRMGVTVVLRDNVTRENIRRYRISDRRQINYLTYRVHTDPVVRTRVSFNPGGFNGYLSFDYIQKRSRHKAYRGRTRVVVSKGGAKFLQPSRQIDAPVNYRRRWNNRVEQYEKRHGMPGRRNFDRQQGRRDHDNDRIKRPEFKPIAPEAMQPQVLPPAPQPQDQTKNDRRGQRDRPGRGQNDQVKRARAPKPDLNNPVVLPKVEEPKVVEIPKAVEAPPVQAPPAVQDQQQEDKPKREGRGGGQRRQAERVEDSVGAPEKQDSPKVEEPKEEGPKDRRDRKKEKHKDADVIEGQDAKPEGQ